MNISVQLCLYQCFCVFSLANVQGFFYSLHQGGNSNLRKGIFMSQQLKAKTINIAAVEKVGSPSFYLDIAAQLSSCPALSVFNSPEYIIF